MSSNSPSSPASGIARRATIPHLPALDGLRGLAVIGVLLFHDDRLRGGYLGVDLFFVLSGFLITSLLIAEHAASGRIDLGAFWIRRARRLFPAVLAIFPIVALYAARLAKPGELARIRGDGLATLAYVANWRTIYAGTSYWELFAAPSPLEHTWSLAIEEQFYVLWPLVVVAVLRVARGATRALLATSAGLAVVSAGAMAWLFDPERTSRAYLGTDTRGAAILVGGALACALAPSTAPSAKDGSPSPEPSGSSVTRALDAAGFVALLGLGVAWLKLDGQARFLYRGGFWLTELAALVLIACAARAPGGLVARGLGIAPLRSTGLVSYGVYLWHWPIFCTLSAARVGFGGVRLSLLRFAVTIAVALVSYRFLEQPIRRHGIRFGPARVVVPGAITIAVGLLVAATRPRPDAATAKANGGGPAIAIDALPAATLLPAGTRRVLVVGDSVAVALGDRLRATQTGSDAFVAVRAVGDCSILEDRVPVHSLEARRHTGGNCGAKWESDVAELRPDVILLALGGGFFATAQIGGAWQITCDRGWHDVYVAELTRLARAVSASGARVVMMRAPYPVGGWASPKWNQQVDCFNALVGEVAAAVPGTEILDLKGRLCPGDGDASCALQSKGAPIRPDGMHFEGVGAEDTARWVLGVLTERR